MRAVLVFILMCSPLAWANSFVGNGGNEGDVELAVTLNQIRDAFKVMKRKSKEDIAEFCECNPMFKGRSVCAPLEHLTDAQIKYCGETLYKDADQVLKLLDQDGGVHVRWTNATIEVVEGKSPRAADAVANREAREITVNQQRFLTLTPAERIFLLTHEYLHFTEVDGHPLQDQGEVGPFTGASGSQQLIDAMAAATGVLRGSFPYELKSYDEQLNRSQNWKENWISLDAGVTSAAPNYDDNFAFNNYTRVQLSFRRQFVHWGLLAASRAETQNKNLTYGTNGDISAKETVGTLGLGLSYRFFVDSDPLTFWGQSYLLLQGLAEYSMAFYDYHDKYVSASDSAKAFGGSVSLMAYMPLIYGLWGYVGYAFEYHPYKYTDPTAQLDLNLNHGLHSGYIGAAYAF